MRGHPSLLLVSLLLGACGGDEAAIESIYSLPASPAELSADRWFDHPWPSDFRRVDDRPTFVGFPNPRNNGLLGEYLSFAEGKIDGFSPAGAGYLRFTGALDPASLPQSPAASLDPAASVQLIDVDRSSPEWGRRIPIRVDFRPAEGVYVEGNTLRFLPSPGFPMRPENRYALVVTDGVRAAGGGAVHASGELAQALGTQSPTGVASAWHAELQPALGSLADLGIAPASIAHLAVFTTGDPTAESRAIADHVRSGEVVAPAFDADWQVIDRNGWVEYQGRFGPSPNYQHGLLPFEKFGDGGDFAFDEGGKPIVADTFDLRFSMSIPKESACPMPAGGYPIVLYAHGTGGNWRSYTSYAETLAQRCIAMMGVDQIFHGTRPGAPDDDFKIQILFFNFQNVEAARANGRQSAIDEVQRARLFTETMASIPASVSHTGSPITFDPGKVLFFGHSQGGLNGPLYLAIDDSARGGVLSGSSSLMSITLLEKTEPSPSIADLVPTVFLGLLSAEREEYDIFHPAIMIAQTLVDAIDPIHYARLVVREPLSAPKSILMTEGIGPDGEGDSYSPPAGIEAQAVAMGLPLMEPVVWPMPQLDHGGSLVAIPPGGLAGNLADGAASGVLAQWVPPPNSDGHFVVFDVPQARAHVAGFLEALAADPKGRVPVP
jgi:hypothetical protein